MQWQFWLVVGVAALLRLPPLARSPFTSDDSLLMLEAARAVSEHTLPATGIFNSLLALNMPLYTWVLLLFATQPLGMAILTGVANTLTIGGAYLFGARYFGRATGLLAGLLFATATYPTWMSVFIWQQTLVPPLLLGALWTLYLGLVDGKRHWLAPHVALLAALVQVYPLTITLAPLTLLGVALRWRSVRWLLDVPLALGVLTLLFTPTYLFERVSGGYDVRAYQAYLHMPSHVDGQVFMLLGQAIGALPADYLGGGTPYAAVAPTFGWLGMMMLALWAMSALAMALSLGVSLLIGARRLLRRHRERKRTQPPRQSASVAKNSPPPPREGGVWGGDWRARLPLVLWTALFLAVTVRHAAPIYIHYAYILTPVLYLMIGWGLAGLARLLRRAGGLVVGIGGALGIAQTVATGAFVVTLVTGMATAASWGGVPIASYTGALAVANARVSAWHGAQAYIAADPADPYLGLYWAQRQNLMGNGPHWTSYTSQGCALTPPHDAGPAPLLVIGKPGLALASLLVGPDARLVERIPMARGASYPLYEIAPNPSGEETAGAVVNGELRLDATEMAPAAENLPARIITRWTALTTTPPGPAVYEYSFHFMLAAPGHASEKITLTCAPGAWVAGEGITLAFALPAGLVGTPGLSVRAQVTRDTHSWFQPQTDGLTLITAKELLEQDIVFLPLGAHTGLGIAHPTQAQISANTLTLLPLS